MIYNRFMYFTELERLDAAMQLEPPDVYVLRAALSSPDWAVAASAAESLGELWTEGRLDHAQVGPTIRSLFDVLGSGGHWWRFGWDQDEPEYNQFRGAAIDAISRFGNKAYPYVVEAVNRRNSYTRDAACRAARKMIVEERIDSSDFGEQFRERVRYLMVNDCTAGRSCFALWQLIEN